MFMSYRGGMKGYAEIAKDGPKFNVGDKVRGAGRYATGHWSKPTTIVDVRVWGSGKDGHTYITKSGGGFDYDELELIPDEVEEKKVAESKAEFWVYDEAMEDINGPFSSSQEATDWVKKNVDEVCSGDEIRILLTYKVLTANPIVEWNEK